MNTPRTTKPSQARRQPVQIRLKPSVLAKVDRLRHAAGQTRSEWLERTIVAELERQQ